MKSELDEQIQAVFAADHAFVDATCVLLRRFRVPGRDGLAFLFDRRTFPYKPLSRQLRVEGKNESYKYAGTKLKVGGVTLADSTGVPYTDGNVELYLCDIKGFRVGVLVDKTKRVK